MRNVKIARLGALAGAVLFLATLAVLLARQFSLGPERPAPDFRTFGPAKAPVRIVEYSDFACGACRAAAGKLEELFKVYGGGIRLQLKHYPLVNIHPWSLDAAAYADCAGEQGKFREYSALLFENQEKWGGAKERPAEFETLARDLRLDWPELEACSAAPRTRRRIKLEMAEGEMKNVNSTPTFFVNGKRAVGPMQLVEQAKKFDNILKAAHCGPLGDCTEIQGKPAAF